MKYIIAPIAALVAIVVYALFFLLSVLISVTFWAAVIYGVLWALEAFFGVGLLSTIKELAS